MKSRVLAILTAFATLTPAFTTSAFAARPHGNGAAPVAFQQGRVRAVQPSYDRGDAREREMYTRYTSGRDARWQFAFRDGYNEGLRDARANRRFNPTDSRQYRDANRGYNRNWGGTRAQFAAGYRNAFRDGYERGYYDIAHRRTGLNMFFHWGR
jgi:hypothetical protein